MLHGEYKFNDAVHARHLPHLIHLPPPTMSHTPSLEHSINNYFAVTVSADSQYLHDPTTLALAHPALMYMGPVGELKDTFLLGAPKAENIDDVVLAALRKAQGIDNVEVQMPKQRTKRDEL
ncbi:hypothetical protein BKA62DRAFT_798861 [Auriculariales sp. MPI-PUGE-AT-0066]|nr:hypothetical protein BKA62DRAFT_798861 [Auriculariales sp. MPI-PUGE-AT-0066]